MPLDLSRRGVLLAGRTGAGFGLFSWAAQGAARRPDAVRLSAIRGVRPRNIVIILTDDHRYDALGFMTPQSFGVTPALDRLAAEGAHFRNAFVTTALCSPSRASILTGLYAHQHRVIDNNDASLAGLTFFPEYLQAAGYDTGYFGKWHMGNVGADPQPGFDRWVSFVGQGHYLPHADGLNIDGRPVPQKGYITDELTDYALEWLDERPRDTPWLMYVSHKGVHSEFVPADRHKGRYATETFRYPATMAANGPQARGRPRWVSDQRNSWHGVDFPYHSDIDIGDYYKAYMETLLAVDEGVARIMDALDARGELDDTLILYLGDNGFAFGEHGLIDKRTAYEESMRIPMLMRCPALFGGGIAVDQVVANIDVAPTLLAAAGLRAPATMEGRDMLPLARGETIPWRSALLYEYYWERNFPQTPTVHALREDRYKFIRFHGLWDLDELYDLAADPLESNNLLAEPGHEQLAQTMSAKLFAELERTGGMQVPLRPDTLGRNLLRNAESAAPAPFPDIFIDRPGEP